VYLKLKAIIELTFLRDDTAKVWITASNGRFSGETEQYINADVLQTLSEQLVGFPKSNSDEVIFEIGEKDSIYGHCKFKFKFYCFDSAGHTAVIVSVSNEIAGNESADNICYAKFKIQFEASSLDEFSSSIKRALNSGEGKSVLLGINTYTQNIPSHYS
jgi:hypothetical protein